MLKKLLVCLLTLTLLAGLVPGVAEEEMSQEDLLKSRESYTRVVEVLGKKYLYYAQNSPEWANLLADESKESDRLFGPSGCIVTSFAIVLANSIPYERLLEVGSLARSAIKIDTRTMARGRGLKADLKFEIVNNSDFLRFLPACIDNWAAGNNRMNTHSATSPGFYKNALGFFGLDFSTTRELEESLAATGKGAFVITCSSGWASPISTDGHFFVIVGQDEEYVYILDPFVRDFFKKDTKGVIEILEPGVIRISKTDIASIRIELQYIIWPDESATEYSQELLEEILADSDQHR